MEQTLAAGKSEAPDIDVGFYDLLADPSGLPALASFRRPRPSRAERLATGRALRKAVPRSAHAAFVRDPALDPVAPLVAQNAGRVGDLVPLRHARMLASPFAFLRGAAATMAADLATSPATGSLVVACGDMHLANFGLFASAERHLIFAINDFDEVHPGPWEWDLKRLAASAAVAARHLGHDAAGVEEAARAVVGAYRRHVRRYAGMGFLEVWYDRIDPEAILAALPRDYHRRAKALMAKARAKGHLRSFERLTETVEGDRRFADRPPVLRHEAADMDGAPLLPAIDGMLRSYYRSLSEDRRRLLTRYRVADVARKVVGVGSVGTDCWVVLMLGRDGGGPLFLQVKQAQPSVIAPHVAVRPGFDNEGQRVAVGQRLIQGSPDIFLGWGGNAAGRHYYVRQLSDMKGGVDLEDPSARTGLANYCRLCGQALALSHAKSGDAAVIAGYCGRSEALDAALARFAIAYADQTERDHAAFERARRAGRIAASDDPLR